LIPKLFFLCPTDCLESVINNEYQGSNFFLTSLGISIPYDSSMLKSIKGIINKHNIGEIHFVLSSQNKIVLDAMKEQNFSNIGSLRDFNKLIKLHESQSNLCWKVNDQKLTTLSYYLNQKIITLQLKLSSSLNQHIVLKGKVYKESENTFFDIYPDLFNLKHYNLN